MLNLDQHRYYNNREITWIDYDQRVLDEASNPVNPLLERARLLGITQNNLDSFVKVRVAKIIKRMHKWPRWRDAMGLTYHDQLNAIRLRLHKMVRKQYHVWEGSLLPKLARHGIKLLHVQDLNAAQRKYVDKYFQDQLYPVITPIAVDGTHPFPFIKSGEICMAVLIRRPNDHSEYFAMIPIAYSFPRVIRLPFNHGNDFILQEDLIKNYLGEIFQGLTVRGSVCFRLTRDQDIAIDDRHTVNLVREVDTRLRKMKYGRPLRIEIEADANPKITHFVQNEFKLNDADVYKVKGPVDLHCVSELVKKIKGHQELLSKKYPPFFPAFLRKISIFKAIRKHDLFFHRPYDSFKPILIFLREAATDPKVISVKITLYRVSKHSPVIAALKQAAKNGKLVTVLIELKARGDEAANTHWALQLQQLGCHVIYGMKGLKVHCKLAMVVRREHDGVRRYMHMSTGNYNEKTAKHYIDMDLFTCNSEIGADATDIFNMLSGFSKPKQLRQLVISPFGIRNFLIHKMQQEISNAKEGKPAAIYMKMNHISDMPIMREIYRASYAGVKVHIIVRTICDLRLNDPQVRKNITVHSLGFGCYLEHSRIYMFENDGKPRVYLSSADMMPRNLSRRVELMFPILSRHIREQIEYIFNLMWKDNVQTQVLEPDDTWHQVRLDHPKKPFSYQNYYLTHRKQIAERLYKRF